MYKDNVISRIITNFAANNERIIVMIKTNDYKTIDSIVLSNYILKHYGPMSHLKLQKLLFYCDAYCLAYFGQELIVDQFEAWVHGPVSRKVFNELKGQAVLYTDVAYSETPGMDVDAEFAKLTTDQQALIKDVLNQLTSWTGLELERATHSERPWQLARVGYDDAQPCHEIISKEETARFYKRDIA